MSFTLLHHVIHTDRELVLTQDDILPNHSCQSVYVFYTIYRQCNMDIILVDWEKPKGDCSSISMWRRVLIANEFDSLQIARKTSLEASLLFVTTFLIENQSLTNNIIEEFARSSFFWIIASASQRLWRFAIYERYITEPKAQRFIDLCTLANVSLVILNDLHHGFYLNCRCPYEFADCAMEDLCENMMNEGRGIVASRELDAPGAPVDCQTYEMYLSNEFEKRYRKVRILLIRFVKDHHGTI